MARGIHMIQTGDGTYWFFIGDSLEDSIAHLHLMIHDGKASITHFYVDPKFRRRGYGSRLLRKAESFSRRKGAKTLEVWLPTRDSNTKRFYQNRGFKIRRVKGRRFPRAFKRVG